MRWYIFCNGHILLRDNAIPTGSAPPAGLEGPLLTQPLPSIDGEACMAVLTERVPEGEDFRAVPLRQSYYVLSQADYRMAGKAEELLYWGAHTKYCSACGTPLVADTDISKRCPKCAKEFWPSLSIAIIVAVTRGDEILLVQSHNFRGNYMGLVAGFVETGESLEECVAREVQEETGLAISEIRYFGSQPWPYPSGLMVGFTAKYAGGTLNLQASELRAGGWFHRDKLPEIPGPMSMARMLIDHWLLTSGTAKKPQQQ